MMRKVIATILGAAFVCLLTACGEHLASDDRPLTIRAGRVTRSEADRLEQAKADQELNRIYGLLNEKLSSEQMDDLRTVQRRWISERDQLAAENAYFHEGGSFSWAAYQNTLLQCTKQRTLELVSVYFNGGNDFSFDLSSNRNTAEIQKNDIGLQLEQQADEIYHIWKQGSELFETDHDTQNHTFQICKVSIGDLNGDNQDDMAIVVEEKQEEPADGEIFPENTRETFVLLKQDDRFLVLCRNKGLVMGEWDGGPYGDAFADIVIADGILTISNYGGSGSRWGYDYSFIYDDHRMRLNQMICLSYNIFTSSGFVETYDYLNGTYKKYSECGPDEGLSGLLLNYGTFTAPPSYFEQPFIDNLCVDNIKYLPQMGDGYGYHEELLFDLKISANDALELVRTLYHSDTEGKGILWTDEIKENHTELFHYQMPDQYFENKEGRLSYYCLNPLREKDEICGAEHVVMWEPFHESEECLFYSINAVTGTIKIE